MSFAANVNTPPVRWLPLRYALRELRGGLRGFYVFIACIALGSMAIAGVGSLAASLADGLARAFSARLHRMNTNFSNAVARCRRSQRCVQWRAQPMDRQR